MLFIIVFMIMSTLASAQDGRLARCEPYRKTVEMILKSYKLSPYFYYLMVAESGCKATVKSDAGAGGFWQLMPATARRFGLIVTTEKDERFDLEKSTHAAAQYLVHLSKSFNTHDDIIRAYNQGGHNLKRHGATREANNLAHTVRRLHGSVN